MRLVPIILCALGLVVSCGTRADYELVHLRELMRHGDHAGVRAQHALLADEVKALPAVRELVLAAELDGAGVDSVELVLHLPEHLGQLRAAAGALSPTMFTDQQRERLAQLAGAGIESAAPSGALARRLEVATLLLLGLTDHRAGHAAGLDQCLRALDAIADDQGPAGLAAARVLAELESTAAPIEASTGGGDPRRAALRRYLETTP